MVILLSLYVILLTALIFYPRTLQIQVFPFALFWEKQRRCLNCAKNVELIIFARKQLEQVISLTVLLPKMLLKHAWILCTSISALRLRKVPSLLHFLPTRATWSTTRSAHMPRGKSLIQFFGKLQSWTLATYDDALWFDEGFLWSSQTMLSSRCSIELLCFDCSRH